MTAKPGFKSVLRQAIKDRGTSLCVGLDPPTEDLPPFAAEILRAKGPAAYLSAYCNALLDVSAKRVPAVKFQSAFFEAFGGDGFSVLAALLKRAKSLGLLTLLDAKRGDISSTMKAYGQMAFEAMGADALTITPYMGRDVVEPLLPWLKRGHGVYVVWVSSNRDGALVQDLAADTIFKEFSAYFAREGIDEALGWVVGATRVEALPAALRARLSSAALLMPGVGAQGGKVTSGIRDLVVSSGAVLVPQSRAIAEAGANVKNINDYIELVEGRVRQAAAELAI